MGWCAAVLALYGVATARGWGGSPARAGMTIPASVRQTPGGYRNYTYWRGGK